MNDDYLKYDGRIPEPPYTTEDERRMELEDIIEELQEMLAIAANNTAAADLAQEMECIKAEIESVVSIDAVEGFLKTLEFSLDCDDTAITLVKGNVRNFAWIVRNELARIMGKETHDDA